MTNLNVKGCNFKLQLFKKSTLNLIKDIKTAEFFYKIPAIILSIFTPSASAR